jgi:hypothetical protein
MMCTLFCVCVCVCERESGEDMFSIYKAIVKLELVLAYITLYMILIWACIIFKMGV